MIVWYHIQYGSDNMPTAVSDEKLEELRLQLIDIKKLLARLIEAIGEAQTYTSSDT